MVEKIKNETHGQAKSRAREELIYEARIVKKLGDHPGVPLVFGICSRAVPFCIVIQFHGDRKELKSLTIQRALAEKTISDKATWMDVIRKFAKAIIHVHEVGFLHNDIKSNNVILNTMDKISYNSVIIDFGKSLPMSGLKGPKVLSKEKQEKYRKKFPHIAPEIVSGKRGQSIKSDIYSLGQIVNSIFVKAKLGPVPKVICQTLKDNQEDRPNLEVITAI